MSWAVRFEDVSKRYRGVGSRRALLHDGLPHLNGAAPAVVRNRRREPRGIQALDRLSFEVRDGEAFALIGPNGAGKTTALKLLTRISRPTGGRVRLRGRVGALIDVGSGIHPELTGRENIWLYGSIMGMSKSEIARRFDEIVEFAELGHVLDVPVKMYSSGMQLRLGFAVASSIDPDLLVVDEALAVGDAGFQAKCIERMTALVTGGRTLLFVSHNLSAVETICSRGLFLLNGKAQAVGEIRDVLRRYLDWVDAKQQEKINRDVRSAESQLLRVERMSLHDASGTERAAFRTGEDLEIRLSVTSELPIARPVFSLGISDGRPGNLILCSMLVDGNIPEFIAGSSTMSCRIRRIPLLPRTYQIWCSVRTGHGYGDIFDWQLVGALRVAEGPPGLNGPGLIAHTSTDAPIFAEYEWWW